MHFESTCGVTSTISQVVTIIPDTKLESYGFLEPAGYAPQDLQMFKCILTKLKPKNVAYEGTI